MKVDSFLAWLWAYLFGPFFFLFRGATLHFFISFLLMLSCVGHLVYPFFAPSILRRMYLERGYRLVEQRPTPRGPVIAFCAICVGLVSLVMLIAFIAAIAPHDETAPSQAPQVPQISYESTPAQVPTVAATPATPPPDDAYEPPDVSSSPAQPAVADLPSPSTPSTPSTPPTPSPSTQTDQNSCIVVGLAAGDYLNVRAAPAMDSAAVFKLANGDVVQVRGESVYNGDTEWVPVASGPQRGWVRNKYLRPYTK